MFGHHKAKREAKRQNRKMEAFQKEKNEWEQKSPEREKEASELQNKQVAEKEALAKSKRKTATEEGRADTEAFLGGKGGLDPEKRKAMQYEANEAIHRNHQSANRKLLGEQSMKGIQGKGGVGYEQQRDLQRLARDDENQVARDLTKLDSDLALKKLAAIYAGGQGEAAQSQLDSQAAIDELNLLEEKKKQKKSEDYITQLFNRL